MTSWIPWLLRAWAGLVLVVAVAAVVDHEPDRRTTVAEGDSEPVAAPATSVPASTTVADPVEPVAEPIVAAPVGVDASAVGISADLVPVGKTPDGALDVPDFGLAGWYRHSVRPGENGPAVLAGHVDSTSGPDVFFALGDLVAGDTVDVRRADGSVVTFVVERVLTTDKDELPIEEIFGDTDGPALRLITCGGAFDRSIRSYESNVTVFARPIDGSGVFASR